MNWYAQSMPTVRDLSPHVHNICNEIKTLPGVKAVYLYGSYANHADQPNYICKDVDIIAATSFDSGDLLAIDNSRQSALYIPPLNLEDEGFNPEAVVFTKRFLSYGKYNVNHWATSSDGKLIHWGAIPDNYKEWEYLHKKAEKEATDETGFKRADLRVATENKRKDWKKAYNQCWNKFLHCDITGWSPSDMSASEIFSLAKEV